MSNTTETQVTLEPTRELTVAFYADPRASTILLTETVSRLIDSRGIDRGIVDLTTLPGLAIAKAFDEAGLHYDSLEFGQADRYDAHDEASRDGDETGVEAGERHPVYRPVTAEDADGLRARATATHTITIDGLGAIDANIVLVPAVQGDSHTVLDFTEGTVIGTVGDQLQDDEQSFMIIDAPERGLRGLPDGSYLRTIVHVQPGLD